MRGAHSDSPRSISAWFDGISLEKTGAGDALFTNGFEVP
jgi:hypothetical protein